MFVRPRTVQFSFSERDGSQMQQIMQSTNGNKRVTSSDPLSTSSDRLKLATANDSMRKWALQLDRVSDWSGNRHLWAIILFIY